MSENTNITEFKSALIGHIREVSKLLESSTAKLEEVLSKVYQFNALLKNEKVNASLLGITNDDVKFLNQLADSITNQIKPYNDQNQAIRNDQRPNFKEQITGLKEIEKKLEEPEQPKRSGPSH